MSEWEGWSADQQQVHITRVLAVLFASLGADGQTRKSTADALTELQIADVQADELAVRLVELGLFRADSLSMAPAQDTLLVTPKGRRVEAEFRQASSRRVVGPPARRALLLWRFDLDLDRPHSSEMLTTPYAWFYGGRFTAETLAAAADNLVARGYLEAMKQTMGRVGRRIQLTATGTACVENYDGDPDAMDNAVRQGQNISIATYHQQGGSAAFGSTVGSQHTEAAESESRIGRPGVDLAAVMQIVNAAGDIPNTFAATIIDAQVALSTATDEDLGPVLEQARQLIATLSGMATVHPAAWELLSAAADYAAQRLATRPPAAVNK